jgi:hypothetical protein
MAEASLTPAEAERIVTRLNLRFAMAIAELEEGLRGAPALGEVLEFRPLAAQAGAAALPEEIAADNDDSIVVAISPRGELLEVQVAAVGFTRAEEVAGRRANFRTGDRTVDYDFRFDVTGQAAFNLAASREVRQALLQGWQVLIA